MTSPSNPNQKVVLWTLRIIFVLVIGLSVLVSWELPLAVLLGWIRFIITNASQWRFVISDVVAAVVVVIIFSAVLHYFLSRLLQRISKPWLAGQTWHWSQSVRVTILILLPFVAGTAILGGIHQLVWLATSGERLQMGPFELESKAAGKLKSLGIAQFSYGLQNDDRLLPAAIYNQRGLMLHGWQTQLLPFLDQQALHDRIQLDQPWTAESNRSAFQTVVPAYVRLEGSGRTDKAYAKTDFAANSRVLAEPTLTSGRVPDGNAYTIMFGEINQRHPAWGSVGNWRDPALGLDDSPDTFGSPRHTVQFAFMDGSIRTFSKDVDPKVLKAYATPNSRDVPPW